MSGVRIKKLQEFYLEIQAECRICGCGLLSEAALESYPGSAVVVKVSRCPRCVREQDEQIKQGQRVQEIAGATIHREGVAP